MKTQNIYNPDDEFLRKYLQGELTPEEMDSLEKHLESDPAAREHFEKMKRIWRISTSIGDFQSIDTEKDWSEWKKKLTAATSGIPPPMDPGKSLEDSPPTLPLRPARHGVRFIRVAASIILATLTASLIYYYTGNGVLSKTDWLTVSSGDRQEEVLLPDDSKVYLNARSSLAYPEGFKSRKRQVKLEGEGFFEIARDEDKPFRVSAGNEASVEVLGTSFNLRTDTERKKVFLNVREGKVAFFPKGKRRQATILEENEQAEYDRGRITQKATFDLNFLSWKTRTLEFDNTPLSDVVEQLGRHYHKEFNISETRLDTLTLTGTYTRQSMGDVLEEIEIVLEIKFNEEDGIIQVR